MDLLMAYESDSDDNISKEASDSECGLRPPSNDCQHYSAVEREHKTLCQNALSSEQKTLTESPETGEINFFGLLDTEETKELKNNAGSKDADSTSQERIVQVLGQSCQVPNSSFWQSFSELDLPGREADSLKRKSVFPWAEFEPPIKVNCVSVCVSNQQHFSHGAFTVSTQNSSSTSSWEEHVQHADCTVKVYTVHPKIAPHLNSHQTNKCPKQEVRRWPGHPSVINRLAWCSATPYSHLLLSASMDSTVKVWNAWAQHKPCVRTLLTHKKAVRDAQWSEDGRSILSCSYDKTAGLTDVQTGKCCTVLDHASFVSSGKFHPVIPNIVATGTSESIQIWDIRSPEAPCRMFTYKEQLGQIQDLMFSHDGQEIFSCSEVVSRDSADRSIMAWDFKTGVTLSNQIFQERYSVTRLCLHPKVNQFIAQTQGGYAAVFSTQQPYKMNKTMRFEGHKTEGYTVGLSVSRDGSLVYSGSAEGKVHCYSFHTAKQIRTFDCMGDVVTDVVCHPVLPSVVAGATWNGNVHVFQ